MDKKPIYVAGKPYGSIEEMPPEVRRVYDLAVAAQSEAVSKAGIKVVFNGKEYASVDSMPEDVRKLYQNQQVAMETYRDFSIDATTPRAAKVATVPAVKMPGGQSLVMRYKWQILAATVALIIVLVLLLRK